MGEIRLILAAADQTEAESEALLNAYVTTESEVLLHHAAEALLRLFLAHRGWPVCPRLEGCRPARLCEVQATDQGVYLDRC